MDTHKNSNGVGFFQLAFIIPSFLIKYLFISPIAAFGSLLLADHSDADPMNLCATCYPKQSLKHTHQNAPKIFCFDLLPDELIFEILQRLPQDLLHRYRCVSKRWLHITTNNDFIRSYIRYNTCAAISKPPFALFYLQTDIYGEETYHFGFSENPLEEVFQFSIDYHSPFRLSSPYNYGLLFSCKGLVLYEETYGFCYYVRDPLMKQWVTVRNPPHYFSKACWLHIGFICKSTSSGCSFRIVHPSWNRSHQILNVYNSESKQWKTSTFDEGFFYEDIHYNYGEAVVCHDLLHWKNDKGSIFVYNPFDARNNCKIIHVPNLGSNQIKTSIIGACNEHLRYFEQKSGNYRLWDLEDYDTGKWNLVREIWFDQFEYVGPIPFNRNLQPLHIHPFDEDVLFLMEADQVIWCNTRLKKLVHIHSLATDRYKQFYPIALP